MKILKFIISSGNVAEPDRLIIFYPVKYQPWRPWTLSRGVFRNKAGGGGQNLVFLEGADINDILMARESRRNSVVLSWI